MLGQFLEWFFFGGVAMSWTGKLAKYVINKTYSTLFLDSAPSHGIGLHLETIINLMGVDQKLALASMRTYKTQMVRMVRTHTAWAKLHMVHLLNVEVVQLDRI